MTDHKDFEFQRLHGMGDSLYNHAMEAYQQSVRIYAPVGSHKDLLPYLVRRLLKTVQTARLYTVWLTRVALWQS